MNLKENIKRILNESTFFRRRVDMSLMDKEFFEVLNYVANKLITKHDEGKIVKFPEFKNRVIDYLIDNYHGELSDWGREEYPYVEVYEFLSNHFKDKIKEKYDLMFNRNINESKTLQENEEDPTQKILNFLLRRYEVEEHIFGDEDRPIIIKMLRIKNSYGQSYSIRSTGSKKEQIRDILDTLMILNVIDAFDFSKTKDNPYAQKAVKAVKMFYDKVMGNKSNMNETIKKEGSLLSIIKDIVEPFKEKGAVCDIDVNYDQEDDMYTVMINFGIKNLDKIFHSVRELQRNWYVDDIRKEVKNEIIGLMSIKNIYVGSTAIDSCDETINESKILDKIKSFLGKKPLSKDDKIINAIVGFIKDNYNIKEFMDTRDNQGDYIYTLIDEHQWVFNYFTSAKRLHYSWKFAEDIHNWIGIDERLLQPDSEMMGKIFEKLFNKKVNTVFGYSRL